MTGIDELNAKADAAAAALEAANGKADALISGLEAARQEIADLKAAGGATPEQLAGVEAKLDGMIASANEQISQDDAALAGGQA